MWNFAVFYLTLSYRPDNRFRKVQARWSLLSWEVELTQGQVVKGHSKNNEANVLQNGQHGKRGRGRLGVAARPQQMALYFATFWPYSSVISRLCVPVFISPHLKVDWQPVKGIINLSFALWRHEEQVRAWFCDVIDTELFQRNTRDSKHIGRAHLLLTSMLWRHFTSSGVIDSFTSSGVIDSLKVV